MSKYRFFSFFYQFKFKVNICRSDYGNIITHMGVFTINSVTSLNMKNDTRQSNNLIRLLGKHYYVFGQPCGLFKGLDSSLGYSRTFIWLH